VFPEPLESVAAEADAGTAASDPMLDDAGIAEAAPPLEPFDVHELTNASAAQTAAVENARCRCDKAQLVSEGFRGRRGVLFRLTAVAGLRFQPRLRTACNS